MAIRQKVVVWCPECPTRMEFYRPDLAEVYQISCPGCGQKSTVHPASQTVIKTDSRAPSSRDSALSIASDSSPLPERYPKLSDSSGGHSAFSDHTAPFRTPPRPKSARTRRSFGVMTVCLVGISGLLTVLLVAVVFPRQLASVHHGSVYVPAVADGPRSVVKDFISASDEIAGAMRSVGGKTTDEVIVDLESSRRRCEAISRRAAAIGPLSDAEADAISDLLSRQSRSAKTKLQDSIERARQTGQYQGRLRAIGDNALTSLDKIQGVVARAWEPIPEPTSATERVGHQVLLVQRRVWLACANPVDERQTVTVVKEAIEELEMLIEQHSSLLAEHPIHRLGSPYFGRKLAESRDLYAMVGPGAVRDALADFVRVNELIVSAGN